MTDITTEPTTAVPNLDSEIDRLVSSSGQRHQASVHGDSGAYRVETHREDDGSLTSTTTVERPPTQSTGEAARLPDNGVDITSTAARMQAQLAEKQARLEAIAGYNPVTGEKLHALPVGSKARSDAEADLNQFKVSVAHQLTVFQKLQAQRSADAARINAADRERALTEAYTRGDPARAAALKAALANAEAAELAAAIIAHRRAGKR